MSTLKVLGLIPARGGSKGVPNKNIRLLEGRPLIAWTIECARASGSLARLVVSTDSQTIADVALEYGAEVPFMRPADLASDTAGSLGVVRHCLDHLSEQGEHYDAVMLLQPTTPFRAVEDIDRAIEIMERQPCDSVVSMVPIPVEDHPHWAYLSTPEGYVPLANGESAPTSRRQDLPPAWRREGSIYLTRTHVVQELASLYGNRVALLEIDPNATVDINTEEDWQRAVDFAQRIAPANANSDERPTLGNQSPAEAARAEPS